MLDQKLNLLSQNICIHYSNLVDDIYQRLMNKAKASGYRGLKLSHALVLLQISEQGSRIIDIARNQAVSKQAIGQIANELEALELIQKKADHQDKRAKLLIITPQGIELIRLAASFLQQMDNELAEQVGFETFQQIQNLSYQLFKQLKLPYPQAGQYATDIALSPLIAHASAIATWLDVELKRRVGEHGHPPLKRSYWHILENITKHGASINDLAQLSGISKQAISQLAGDIEKEGYIKRKDNPLDKRSKQLILSKNGHLLVEHTLTAVQQIETQVEQLLGKSTFLTLKQALERYAASADGHNNSAIDSQVQQALQAILAKNPTNNLWLQNQQLSDYAIQALKQMRFNNP